MDKFETRFLKFLLWGGVVQVITGLVGVTVHIVYDSAEWRFWMDAVCLGLGGASLLARWLLKGMFDE